MSNPVQVYLTRRNLETLLTKLDKVRAGEVSLCTIVKTDTAHSTHPQSHDHITVTAVENEDYYVDRPPGVMVEDLENL